MKEKNSLLNKSSKRSNEKRVVYVAMNEMTVIVTEIVTENETETEDRINNVHRGR